MSEARPCSRGREFDDPISCIVWIRKLVGRIFVYAVISLARPMACLMDLRLKRRIIGTNDDNVLPLICMGSDVLSCLKSRWLLAPVLQQRKK